MPQVGEYEYDTDNSNVLGFGKQGTVYLGHHQTTGDLVAIKVTRKKSKYTDQELQILQKVSRLKSPHIVALLHHEESSLPTHNRFWCLHFVTEFCNHGDLHGYLRDKLPDKSTAHDLMHQFASGLQVLYKNGIVHRDLKPENLLLHVDPSTQELVLKIADLGVAKVLEDDEDAATVIGTFTYMAPEIALRCRYDFKVDLWSFGVIASQCYRGLHTHPVQNVSEHSTNDCQLRDFYTNSKINISTDGLPATLADLLKKVLVSDPTHRIEPRDFFRHRYLQQQRGEVSDNESTCSRTSGYASALDNDDSRSNMTSSMASLRMTCDDTRGASAPKFRPSSLSKLVVFHIRPDIMHRI